MEHRCEWRLIAAAGLSLMAAMPLHAMNFDLGEARVAFTNRAVLGGAIRLSDRAPETIGKLNLNPDLCPDDCFSFTGDPEPNQRLVDAPGAFIGSSYDDGNLNYDRWDFVSAQARLESKLNVQWGDAILQVSGLAFFDAINNSFTETNTDTAFQPARVARSSRIERQVGTNAELLEAFVSYPFSIGNTFAQVSIGEQRVRWGESTFVVLGSLDQLNPPDENRLNFPGADIASVFRSTGLAVLSAELTGQVSAELVYQYRWEPARPAASGSFYSVNDIAGGGDYAVIGIGQFSEDPNFEGGFKSPIPQLISSTPLNVPIDSRIGKPRDQGQFGAKITYFAPDFNGGTEFGFYALNYHSRLPYLSAFAAQRSCLRDATLGGLPSVGDVALINDIVSGIGGLIPGVVLDDLSLESVGALLACGGGNGSGLPGQLLSAAVPGEPQEPLPIGTFRPFLDYPEDIHMFGLDFTTQLGSWSLAGEYVFQPNFPLQVSAVDVSFAGLQPALPADDLTMVVARVPGARNATPDFLQTRFRGETVTAGQRIRGYERQKLHQLGLTGLRVFSGSNRVGADQIILLAELGMTYIQDMPSLSELQFEGGGPNCTHFSPGADGTGADAPDTRRFNPTQSTRCFADDFSTGYRLFIRPAYNNLVFGWSFEPIIGFFHDFYGTAPFPAQNFAEDRMEVLLGTDIQFAQGLRAQLLYQGFFGSGDRVSLVQDRDNFSFAIEYNF
jgi:hypothetical protein